MNESLTDSQQYSQNNTLNQQERLVERLDEAQLDTQRFVDVNNGEKRSQDHTQLEFTQILGNYGVYAGKGANESGKHLVILDVDDYDGHLDTESIEQLPDTLLIRSPHGGNHLYFAVEGPIVEAIKSITGVKNPDMVWGETRIEGMLVVGPGSQIDPGEYGCDKEWCDSCARNDGGYYEITQDLPIATVGLEELLSVVKSDHAADQQPDEREFEAQDVLPTVEEADFRNVDEDMVDKIYKGASKAMFDIEESHFSDEWHGLISGNGERFTTDDDSSDRSKADLTLFTYAYGFAQEYTDIPEEEVIEATGQFLTYVCRENDWTRDGQARKWLVKTGGYRDKTASTAVKNYSPSIWKAWVNQKGKGSGLRGETRYNSVRAASIMLSMRDGEYIPEQYPKAKKVERLAQLLDTNSVSLSSYRNARIDLTEGENLKKHCITEYQDYRYTPEGAPDHPQAEWVETGGTKRETEANGESGSA